MDWKPIETAPGPLVDVLVWDANPSSSDGTQYFVAHRELDGRWRNSHQADGEEAPEPRAPTHWAELAPPRKVISASDIYAAECGPIPS